LSAFLLHPNRSQRTSLTPSEEALAPQIASLGNALNTFLGYFVLPDQQDKVQQLNHLQAVIFECSKLGFMLFSHPSDWRFIHRAGYASSMPAAKVAVVCAGLEKLSNKDGTAYSQPAQVVAPTVVQI
jgi:hypothetical protein